METKVESPPAENADTVSESITDEKVASVSTNEPTKRNKKDDRNRKDEKSIEALMKSLNSVPNSEDKLSTVCKKYVQAMEDNKKMQFYIKQSDKRYALILKEKEQLQHEYNKTILAKSKLENLCRELQKQNKAIKEESLVKIREEEERRKETQSKFQNTLSEITTLLQQNNEKNAKLRDDNISMSEKFKSVVQQYQLREQQVDKMAKQMALESQLSEAKIQKASLEHQAEKGRMQAEMEQLKMELAQSQVKISELKATETTLRGQIDIYTDKYDEFQNALVKSNQVFGGFKGEMEKMSKKIQKLEKESLSWKKRWETSQTALIDMCTERQAIEERVASTAKQLHHMQGLCRTLQAERTVLLSTLKEHNIERPPVPTPPPAPAPAPAPSPSASNAKVDAMAANCAQLRQSLAHLQNQLNVLTNQKEQTKEEPPKTEKKKSKSKKNKQDKAQLETAQEKPEETTETDKTEEPQIVDDESKVVESEKTVEKLIEAISQANTSLCDLQIDEANTNGEVKEADSIEIVNSALVTDNDNATTDDKVINDNVETTKLNVTDNGIENGNLDVQVESENVANDLNEGSFVELNPNEEISHILEVKPIVNKKEEVSS